MIPPAVQPPEPTAQRDRLAAVLELGRAVGSTLDVDELLLRIMAAVTGLVEAERSTLFVVDRQTGALWSRVLQASELTEIRLAPGAGIAGWVAQHDEVVRLDDAYADPRFDRAWDDASGFRTRSLLCAPLRNASGAVVGVVQCLNKRVGTFDRSDAELLMAVGFQCALALENAFLYASLVERNAALASAEQEVRRTNRELEVLLDVEQRISRAAGMHDLTRSTLELLCTQLEVDSVALLERTTGLVQGRAEGGRWWTRRLSPPAAERAVEAARVPTRLMSHELEGLRWAGIQGAAEAWVVPLGSAEHPFVGVLVVGQRDPSPGAAGPRLRTLMHVGSRVARGLAATLRRERSEQARRMQTLGTAVSGIVHDLRTPMAAVRGYAEMMAAEEAPDERTYCARRIDQALRHMDEMTREVLGFARGEREVFAQKLELGPFIDEVVELLSPELETLGLSLVVQARYRGLARLDPGKLRRVIANLSRNAGQATGAGGTLTWTVERAEELVVMSFADDGPGIPEPIQARLFEPFASSGKAGGTGLGLPMARRIVEAHGGTLLCERTGPTGTTFRMELPLADRPVVR